MPEGDDVYLTIAQAIPYVNYVATAYKVIEEMYNFGRESEVDKAIRLLNVRVAELEQSVRDLDDRLSELEQHVAQNENLSRLRTITENQLEFGDLARDLASHPEDGGDIAGRALNRLRAMFQDEDLWMWSDILRKPADAAGSWRAAPAAFKGVGLPTFAIGTMIWAIAAGLDSPGGTAHKAGAAEILQWISMRPEWIPYETVPISLSERFRSAINVEIAISSKYVTAAGYCEYAFVAVNGIERTRASIRDVDVYFGQSSNTMCTADPRIADGDEAVLEDESPQIRILLKLEDAVARIRDHGSLADPFPGKFPDWTAHRLALYGIEPSGEMRRFQIDTTTALTEPPVVEPVGGIVGTGWQNFTDVFGTYNAVVYAFSGNGAIDWYREDDLTLGPSGWKGPKRVRAIPSHLPHGRDHGPVNGGGGTFYVVRPKSDRIRIWQSLELITHPDPANGTGLFSESSVVIGNWGGYSSVFGGGSGVIYGIDAAGDLYWFKHTSWPNPGTGLEGPVRIGNGWNSFSRVFAFGNGFIAGLFASGEMWLYHFQQWQRGPGNEGAVWHGPVRLPGTQWRGFKALIPMVGDAPPIIH